MPTDIEQILAAPVSPPRPSVVVSVAAGPFVSATTVVCTYNPDPARQTTITPVAAQSPTSSASVAHSGGSNVDVVIYHGALTPQPPGSSFTVKTGGPSVTPPSGTVDYVMLSDSTQPDGSTWEVIVRHIPSGGA